MQVVVQYSPSSTGQRPFLKLSLGSRYNYVWHGGNAAAKIKLDKFQEWFGNLDSNLLLCW